eukprot:UN20738
MEKHNINFTTAVFKQLLKVCSATNKIGRSMYIFQNIREREKDNLKGDFWLCYIEFLFQNFMYDKCVEIYYDMTKETS